jgi:hypothetical protein
VTTGWNNEQAKDATRRTLKGGSSGRVAVFVIVAGLLALGIYTDNLYGIVLSAIGTALATASLASSWRSNRAARRLGRDRSPARR